MSATSFHYTIMEMFCLRISRSFGGSSDFSEMVGKICIKSVLGTKFNKKFSGFKRKTLHITSSLRMNSRQKNHWADRHVRVPATALPTGAMTAIFHVALLCPRENIYLATIPDL